ncbi:rRNA maturation RNase YbeY [Maricaulis sp.]|uniref:rRNA maturation RNase YbeY n=1 Tax=unclassified Maricaulis TaxID=2632371 RepID=UPI001B06723B|nr:rRNA maturation RNase YbeY [Maricaulis sp.]MBO6795691.1 rRNA maturation RNase YbeY [Maricaulis sp.]
MNAVDVIVEDDSWNALKGKAQRVQSCLEASLAEIGEGHPGVVAVLLTGNDPVAEMNERFRGKQGPTNVLSFPAIEGADNQLGDIALAWGVVEREATDKGISIENHLSHLIVHGFLHLQGYDHLTDAEAEEMEGIERRALARLGIADPYSLDGTTHEGTIE